MNLQHLLYFIAVSDRGSINQAAEALFITQPNLSKAMVNLETELGTRLFERSNRGVKLTDDGKKLYQYAQTISDQLDLINRISSKDDSPKVFNISSYPILTASRLLGKFYLRHDKDKISLSLKEMRLQKIVESVASCETEIGLIMVNNVQTKELKHMLAYRNLEFTMLGQDTWYANVGPNNPLYNETEIDIRQLLEYPVVRMQDDYFSNLTFYLEIDGVKLTEFKKVIFANDSGAILHLMRNTNVFRFGPGLSKKDFEEYGIRTIPIKNCEVKIICGWIRRQKELLSPEIQEFIASLEKLILEELPQNIDIKDRVKF